jgi:hypothetical protein
MSDTNGTVAERAAEGRVGEANRVSDAGTEQGTKGRRAKPAAGGKFGRLYALLGKAQRQTFTLTREVDGGTFRLRVDGGLPATLDAAGVGKLAAEKGGRATVSADIGAAGGRGGGVVTGATAAEMVADMTAE